MIGREGHEAEVQKLEVDVRVLRVAAVGKGLVENAMLAAFLAASDEKGVGFLERVGRVAVDGLLAIVQMRVNLKLRDVFEIVLAKWLEFLFEGLVRPTHPVKRLR